MLIDRILLLVLPVPAECLIANFFDAENASRRVAGDCPLPECRIVIEPIMQVLRCNEDIGVQKLPSESDSEVLPNSRNVAIFWAQCDYNRLSTQQASEVLREHPLEPQRGQFLSRWLFGSASPRF
jgi:hypothetical protein